MHNAGRVAAGIVHYVMKSEMMPMQVYPQIYCQRIPLPNNPLKELNCYIVVSAERNLVVDTGFNREECKEAFFAGLAQLGVNPAITDVVITHRHSDHSGLAGHMEKLGARIFTHEKEWKALEWMVGEEGWQAMTTLALRHGLAEYDITARNHPGYLYRPQPIDNCTLIQEGDSLDCGDYEFKVMMLSGHTPGHIGLYEEKHGLLFCGDHILAKITPNITYWDDEQDSLAQYLDSLRRVCELPIKQLFTAHREPVPDYRQRIDVLMAHHATRLKEILTILNAEPLTAAQVAARMAWEIRAKSWADFPKAQKWFATGEAAAHLTYLVNQGKAVRIMEDGIALFSV